MNRIEITSEQGKSKNISFIIVNDITLQKQLEKQWCYTENIKYFAEIKALKYGRLGYIVFNFVK